MVVKIRLSRFGYRHQPVYNIVVSQARTARDSLPMEVLGTYDPRPKAPLSAEIAEAESAAAEESEGVAGSPTSPPVVKRYKEIQLDQSRTKYWLGVGAQPSEPVWKLLTRIGLLPSKPGRKWTIGSDGQRAKDDVKVET